MTSGVCTDSVTFNVGYLDLIEPTELLNGLKNPNMTKQGTAGKRKHVTLILQKPEIIRCESGKSQREVITSYSIGLSTINDIMKQWDQLQSVIASSGSVKGIFK
jgi:hypothetical protein